MAKRPEKFGFNPAKHLGSVNLLCATFEAIGMHMHLACIAFASDPPCSIPDDDAQIREWLRRPRNWSRVKKSVLNGWILNDGRWYLPWLLDEYERLAGISDKRSAAAKSRWEPSDSGDANAHANADFCMSSHARALSLSLGEGEGVFSEGEEESAREGGTDPDPATVQAVGELAFKTLGTLPANTCQFWAATYPFEWIRAALMAAEAAGKKKVKYVQGILGNYASEGPPDIPQPGAAPEPRKYAGVGETIGGAEDE